MFENWEVYRKNYKMYKKKIDRVGVLCHTIMI